MALLTGKPRLEWQVCEHETEWAAAHYGMRPADQRRGRGRLWKWWAALAAALLATVVALGVWGWQAAQAGLAQVEEEVGAVVEAELWVAEQGRPDPVASLSPADASVDLAQQITREAAALQREVAQAGVHETAAATLQVLDLRQAWAVVRVDLPATSDRPAYRQTRVYRHTEMGWMRTAPAAGYWGAARRLETEHFIFRYYARDAEAVTAAAAKLDALYPGLAASYGESTKRKYRVKVKVDPAEPPGRLTGLFKATGALVTASPATYLAPETVSEADLLAQAVVLALVDDLATPVLQHPRVVGAYPSDGGEFYRWYPLVYGVQLWQLWAQDLPLAAWREPVVTWALGPLRSDLRAGEPEFLPALCADHRLWMFNPYGIRIPFWCGTSEQEKGIMLRMRALSAMPPSPPQLQRFAPLDPAVHAYGNPELTASGAPPPPTTIVALATVVEYAAETYGPESIPVLLAGLSEHTNWESLVPAVFEVSEVEFEAGWRAYLAKTYGASTGN